MKKKSKYINISIIEQKKENLQKSLRIKEKLNVYVLNIFNALDYLEDFEIVKGFESIKDFDSLEDLEKNDRNNRLLKRGALVLFGGCIVFFAGNIILGNGLLPAASIAASGVLQKQKQKLNETVVQKAPEAVAQSLNVVKEIIEPIVTKQMILTPLRDNVVKSNITKSNVGAFIDLGKGVLQNQNGINIWNQEKMFETIKQFRSKQVLDALRGGTNNIPEVLTIIGTTATVGLGKNLWRLFDRKKNQKNNQLTIDSEKLGTSTNTNLNSITNTKCTTLDTAIIGKSKEDILTETTKNKIGEPVAEKTFMGIAMSIWSHILVNYKIYVGFIFLISLVFVFSKNIQTIDESFSNIINNLITKLKASVKKKEIPRWVQEIRRNKEELKKMYEELQMEVQKEKISLDTSENTSEEISEGLPANGHLLEAIKESDEAILDAYEDEILESKDELYNPYRDLELDQDLDPDLAYVDKPDKRYSNVFLPKDIIPKEVLPKDVFPDYDDEL